MNERIFQFRLRSSHPAPDRANPDLVVMPVRCGGI